MTDLSCRQGNSAAWTIVCKQADGSAFDLTGSTMVFRALWLDTVIELSTADDTLTMDDPTDGRVGVALTPAQTRTIPVGRLMPWELERRIDGTERTLVSGYLDCEAGVNSDG